MVKIGFVLLRGGARVVFLVLAQFGIRLLLFELHLSVFEVLIHVRDLVKETQKRHVYLLRNVAYVEAEVDDSAGVFLQLASRDVKHVLLVDHVVDSHVSHFLHIYFDSNFLAQEGRSFRRDVQVEFT